MTTLTAQRREVQQRMTIWWDRLATYRAALDIHNTAKNSRFGRRIIEHHIRNCRHHLERMGLQLLELELAERRQSA